MAYILDANVFIQAKNLHYGFDFCPAFWDWLILNNQNDTVFSIEQVGDEIEAGNDALATWAKDRGSKFFLPPDDAMIPALATVTQTIQKQDYTSSAKNDFFNAADYYLIAYALAHKHTIVTHEKPDGSKKRIKIPEVCILLSIKCLQPHMMLRKEKARFVLGTSE